jgi:hypothetical protein
VRWVGGWVGGEGGFSATQAAGQHSLTVAQASSDSAWSPSAQSPNWPVVKSALDQRNCENVR